MVQNTVKIGLMLYSCGQSVETLCTSWFSGSGLVGLPSIPWTEKTNERSPFFVRPGGHCCRRDLVGRTTFWIFFLVGLQKLAQRAKKCVERRGEYAE